MSMRATGVDEAGFLRLDAAVRRQPVNRVVVPAALKAAMALHTGDPEAIGEHTSESRDAGPSEPTVGAVTVDDFGLAFGPEEAGDSDAIAIELPADAEALTFVEDIVEDIVDVVDDIAGVALLQPAVTF